MSDNRKSDKEKIEELDVKGEIVSWVKTILFAVILAFVISKLIIVNAVVPTGSMENTIMPKDRLIGNRLSYKFGEPERGDVIIFKFPDDESQLYVKRIIGLPGETVTIKDGKVYINDSETPLVENYIKEEFTGDFGPYVVPEDSYFMLGDNRNNSLDSRYWENKFVHKDKILGKAIFKYYPRFKKIEGSSVYGDTINVSVDETEETAEIRGFEDYFKVA